MSLDNPTSEMAAAMLAADYPPISYNPQRAAEQMLATAEQWGTPHEFIFCVMPNGWRIIPRGMAAKQPSHAVWELELEHSRAAHFLVYCGVIRQLFPSDALMITRSWEVLSHRPAPQNWHELQEKINR